MAARPRFLVETLDRLEAMAAPKRSAASAESAVLQALRERVGGRGETDPTRARSDPELIRIIEAQRAALRDRLQPMHPRDWGEGIARSYRKARRSARNAVAAERRGDPVAAASMAPGWPRRAGASSIDRAAGPAGEFPVPRSSWPEFGERAGRCARPPGSATGRRPSGPGTRAAEGARDAGGHDRAGGGAAFEGTAPAAAPALRSPAAGAGGPGSASIRG
ncbi:MAG: hypothetical protein U5R48_19690 [Gammaproteobacteria bacterium]|nr:hypothetical protein [Gammaproteobacteria bacterium]